MSVKKYPGDDLVDDPLLALTYTIEANADPQDVWPWLLQMGYNRGGWYIDTWWDQFSQDHVWPRFVPKEARGRYYPPAEEILPEYQSLQVGDTIPDGPPGTPYYDIVGLEENSHLLLRSTTHFKYMVPSFLMGTRFEPYGEWSWAFILEPLNDGKTRIMSRWRGKGGPRLVLLLWLPLVRIADHFHQRQILKGLKRRVETAG